MAGKYLREIAAQDPSLDITTVDVTVTPLKSLRDGTPAIPALQVKDTPLKGLVLGKQRIEKFLEQFQTSYHFFMKDFILASVSLLDLAVWLLVVLFFCGSATLFNGSMQMAFIGSIGIIVEMLIIGISIEIIIEILKNTKGIGTLTGFITNGPEAVCLIVGLVVGDIIFASSTPLGSNFMNPLLLFCAALVSGKAIMLLHTHRTYTITTILLTATAAVLFFALAPQFYIFWVIIVVGMTLLLFFRRPDELACEDNGPLIIQSKFWLIPAIAVLTMAGYFLDPIVSFAAAHSHAPKGVIGFVVLATLTSWPEFKSSLSLLRRSRPAAAVLNITVSNITNIWLAAGGIVFYLFSL